MSSSSRRKFLQKVSLGVMGASIGTRAFAASPLPLFQNKKQLLKADSKSIRKEFLLEEGLSYFNTGSLGPSTQQVVETVYKNMCLLEANPVSNNWGPIGRQANAVRTKIANYINAQEDEIILTRNTTEGMNMLVKGLQLKEGDEVIISTDEHYGGRVGWEYLEKHQGIKVKKIAFPRKNLTTDEVLEIIKKQITSKTKVCSFMDVSTVTGMRMPFKELSEITKPKGIFLISDGAQSIGMLQVDVKVMGVDAFAASGHKWMLGPKETGFLYIAKNQQKNINTLELASGYKLYNHNTGTRNVANFIGLGKAIDEQAKWGGIQAIEKHNTKLASYLLKALQENKQASILTSNSKELQSGIVAITPKRKTSKEIYTTLKEKNMVVKNLGKINVLRFSTHIFNTQKEVDVLIRNLTELL
ncbi:Aminotransferase class V-fold PLP-dependent enzyme [Tenacibaculum sp. 190524A02b]|uniref:Aminotransferase class V-fold PLP-dependent enzyme n=1 Tax=Tenacibaculum vairaonense TaxID=3137860 RepID=A0ABP1F9G4_9FLAO